MNNQDKQIELKRLHDLVFDGAPDEITHAAMGDEGTWFVGEYEQGVVFFRGKAKNQPETFLHWTDSLIEKGDV